jgi:hypothetical protein
VANSVRHRGAPASAFVQVSVELTDTAVRVEVADPGSRRVVAPRGRDGEGDGGFGLNLVLAIADLWGFERTAIGGTRVWAQIGLALPAATAAADGSESAEASVPR